MIRLKQKITGLILKQEKRIASPAIWRGIVVQSIINLIIQIDQGLPSHLIDSLFTADKSAVAACDFVDFVDDVLDVTHISLFHNIPFFPYSQESTQSG